VVLNYPANNNVTPETSLDFSFNETDPVYATAVCNLTVDDSSVNSTTATNNTPADMGYSGLVGGPHTWSVSCTDGANNTNTSATWNFTVTTMGPTVILISPINGLNTSATSLNFTFNETDPSFTNASCSLMIDGASVNSTAAANSTLTTLGYSVPSDGTYNWNVTCIDGASNSGSSLKRHFTVDTTPPVVTLDSPANLSLFNYSSITFNFTPVDNLAPTMSCSIFLDNVLNSTNPSVDNDTLTGFPISGIADGNHTWYVACTDNANNTGPSATWDFGLSTAQPTISGISNITQTATNLTTNVTYSPTAKDEFNASVPVSCTPASGSLFPIGTTQVNCSATDVYGNTVHASFNVTENPGTTAPAISGISNITDTTANPSGATETYNPTATDEYGSSVNVSCTPASGFLFPIGTTQVNCSATDDYNNTANASFNVTETLSSAPPPAPSPPSGPSEQLSSLSLSSSIAPCPADAVTISASSGEGADIRLLLTSPYGGLVDEQATGSDGTATFSLSANGTYEADASSPGYRPASTTFTFTTCPVAPPANITPPVTPQSSCTSDADCPDNESCSISAGETNGTCEPIIGCGSIANHVLTPYECGTEPGCPQCPQNSTCQDHACIGMPPAQLTCPPSEVIGVQAPCVVTQNNQPVGGCGYTVIGPGGNGFSGSCDKNGNFKTPTLTTPGEWTVEITQNGQVVSSTQIMVTSQVSSAGKPPAATATPSASSLLSLLCIPIIIVLLLLILLLILFLLWKRRKKKQRKYGTQG